MVNQWLSTWKTPSGTNPITPTHAAAQLLFNLRSAVRETAITSGASYVDICKASNGYFNFLSKSESITVNSSPENSALYYNEGDELILHCSSDVDPATATGTENYDQWYYVKLLIDSPVYLVNPATRSTISTGQYVGYTSGTTNYWKLENLEVVEKAAGTTGVECYLKYYATILSSVTDGASWDDTVGEINANQTLPDDSERLIVEIAMDDANNAFAVPIYTVGLSGGIETRIPVIIFSTTMIAIDESPLLAHGWHPLTDNTLYTERAWYHVIDPCIPSKGQSYGSWTCEIPIECGSAAGSTAFQFKVWVIEGNTEDAIQRGQVTANLPTIYGFITEIGPDSGDLDQRAYTTAAGAGATQVLYTYITTAA